MRLKYGWLLIQASLLFNAAAFAESVNLVSQEAVNARKLLGTLRSHHLMFAELLTKKSKIDAWEKKLRQSDQALREKFKDVVADQARVKQGKLSRDDFNLRWKASGRLEEIRQAVIHFRAEVKKYNLFRQGYNRLANQLKLYLHKRKPEELLVLMSDMRKLIAALDEAFRNRQYDKAVALVAQSKIASEFGYKK